MDGHIIKNTSKDKSLKLILGGILILFGIASITEYVGIAFLLLALAIFFYSSGTEFDIQNHKVRQFYALFGKRKGNLKNIDEFYALSVKKVKKGYRTRSRSNTSYVDSLNIKYEVWLMGKKQADTFLLFDSKNKTEALDFANHWSLKIGLPVKAFGKN